MMSITAHKIYGPKGIGATFISNREPKIQLAPMLSGGGQERGYRSGTLAPHMCVALGEAARIA